jgi:PTS system nitrogen regulatory IIA component
MIDLFLLTLCRESRTHLRVLTRLGHLIQMPDFLDELRSSDDSHAAYDVIYTFGRQLAGG